MADDDTAGVTVSPDSLTIGEGNFKEYTVVLDSQPSANVTVTVGRTGSTDVTARETTLTFTPSDWDDEQTVRVSAAQDDTADDETATITHTVRSTDTSYHERSAGSVAVTVEDDETPGIVLSESPLEVDEDDSDGETYTVKLSHKPTVNVTVSISGHSGTDLTLNKTSLTFTTSNWNSTQTVRVTPSHDDDASDDSVTLKHTASGGEYEDVSQDLRVTVDDDDTSGVTVSSTSLTVAEGDSDEYTVVLKSQPAGDVTVTISVSGSSEVTADQTSLTFTTSNWDDEKTVEVSAGQDDDADNDRATISHAVSGYGTVTTADSVAVTVTDDDDPDVKVSFEETAYSVNEGGRVTVNVNLDRDPRRTVTIPVTSANQGGATSADYSLSANSVTFNSGDTEKSFNFTAAQDTTDDDGESVKLGFGTLPAKVTKGTNGEATVSINDDDNPDLTVKFGAPSYTAAEGGSAAVKIILSKAPERSVTIPVTATLQGGASASDYTLSATSASFGANETEKTITLNATDDTVDDDGESVKLAFGTLPSMVTAATPSETTVSITDNDPPRHNRELRERRLLRGRGRRRIHQGKAQWRPGTGHQHQPHEDQRRRPGLGLLGPRLSQLRRFRHREDRHPHGHRRQPRRGRREGEARLRKYPSGTGHQGQHQRGHRDHHRQRLGRRERQPHVPEHQRGRKRQLQGEAEHPAVGLRLHHHQPHGVRGREPPKDVPDLHDLQLEHRTERPGRRRPGRGR